MEKYFKNGSFIILFLSFFGELSSKGSLPKTKQNTETPADQISDAVPTVPANILKYNNIFLKNYIYIYNITK